MHSLESLARVLRPEDFDDVVASETLVLPLHRERIFYHSGDFGDIIYALPTIRALGGGRLLIGPSPQWKTRLTMNARDVAVLKPLLEAQPYITGVEFSATPPPNMDFDLNRFREYLVVESDYLRQGKPRLNLAEAHLYTFRLPLEECQTPWLTVEQPWPIPGRPVILHRSSRWRSAKFPWDRVMAQYGEQATFVGLPWEHDEFELTWGSVPYHPSADLLVLARLIAGCQLYIGNQSLPYALCEGLKRTSVLEVWPEGPNCIFKRPNAHYSHNESVYIPKLNTQEPMITRIDHCPLCLEPSTRALPFRDGTDIVKCAACALIYLRSHPDKEQTMLYYQRYADDTSHMRLPKLINEISGSGLRREPFMREILKHAPTGGELLDIGCGWGAFLLTARDHGYVPSGIDVCAKAANFGKTVLGLNITINEVDGDAFSHPACMGKYTVVTAIHTLEHLVDTAAVLKRIHDLLRPGGVFCGIVPNINSLCSHAYEERWQWLDTNTHYVHFTPATLRAALLQFGFEVLQTSTCTGDYDQAELLQLLEKKADRKLAGNDLAKALKETWAAGSGEEIHFFACKKLT